MPERSVWLSLHSRLCSCWFKDIYYIILYVINKNIELFNPRIFSFSFYKCCLLPSNILNCSIVPNINGKLRLILSIYSNRHASVMSFAGVFSIIFFKRGRLVPFPSMVLLPLEGKSRSFPSSVNTRWVLMGKTWNHQQNPVDYVAFPLAYQQITIHTGKHTLNLSSNLRLNNGGMFQFF